MLSTLARTGRFFRGNLHTHTTVSDGEKTPAETAALYRNAGYDFIALTDHNRWGSYPELCSDGFLVLPGAEIDTVWQNSTHHLVAIGTGKTPFAPGYAFPPEFHRGVHPQQLTDTLVRNGCMVIYAHPFWSYCDQQLLSAMRGLTGMEIINYSCEQEWKSGISETYFEYLWRDKNRIWCFGSDDAHGHVPDYLGGSVMVKADNPTPDSLLSAIRAGSFYACYHPNSASSPELIDFYVENGTAYVYSSPCRTIYIIARREHPGYKPLHGTPEHPVSEHSWALPEGAVQVKCVLTGFDGSITWSQPILL